MGHFIDQEALLEDRWTSVSVKEREGRLWFKVRQQRFLLMALFGFVVFVLLLSGPIWPL